MKKRKKLQQLPKNPFIRKVLRNANKKTPTPVLQSLVWNILQSVDQIGSTASYTANTVSTNSKKEEFQDLWENQQGTQCSNREEI